MTTLELPRSQPTAVDPWAEYPEGPPPALRGEVVPTRWAVTPPPAPRPPRPPRPARPPRRARRPRSPRPRPAPRVAPVQQFVAPALPYGWPAPYRRGPRRHVASAYALWLFFGALGVHRFYLGRTFSGVVYLLLFVLSPLTLFLSLPVLALCLLVDLFAIPGMTRGANRRSGWPR